MRILFYIISVIVFLGAQKTANTLNTNYFSQREMSFIQTKLEVRNDEVSNDADFKQFIKKFNTDSVFQISRVKFPLKVTWLLEDSLLYLDKTDYSTMDFSVKKSSRPSNRWKQTVVETNTTAVIQIRGFDNGIYIDYLFEKMKGIWIFTEIVDGST